MQPVEKYIFGQKKRIPNHSFAHKSSLVGVVTYRRPGGATQPHLEAANIMDTKVQAIKKTKFIIPCFTV